MGTETVVHKATYTSRTEGIFADGSPINQQVDSWSEVIPPTVTTRNSNPNWKALVRSRKNASLAYSRVHFNIVRGNSMSTVGYGVIPLNRRQFITSSTNWPGYFYGYPFSRPSLMATAIDQAVGRIKAKLDSDVQRFKALAPTAELRELRGLIRQSFDLAASAMRTLKHIKHGEIPGGRNSWKRKFGQGRRDAADAWLHFGFGVQPLLRDIDQALQSVAYRLYQPDHLIRERGGSQVEWQDSYRTTGWTYGYNPMGRTTSLVQGNHLYRVSFIAAYAVRCNPTNDYYQSVYDQFGLDFGSLPGTAWELTPYSWVVDYVATVGPFLDDLFWSPPGQTIYQDRVEKLAVDLHATITSEQSTADVILLCTPGHHHAYYTSFSRTPIGSLPHRALRFRTWDEIGKHAGTKLLNLASILAK